MRRTFRGWSGVLFVWFLALALVAVAVLYWGLHAIGDGHGTAMPWYVGVGIYWLGWLCFIGSVITGAISWIRVKHPSEWYILSVVLLVALSWLGLRGIIG